MAAAVAQPPSRRSQGNSEYLTPKPSDFHDITDPVEKQAFPYLYHDTWYDFDEKETSNGCWMAVSIVALCMISMVATTFLGISDVHVAYKAVGGIAIMAVGGIGGTVAAVYYFGGKHSEANHNKTLTPGEALKKMGKWREENEGRILAAGEVQYSNIEINTRINRVMNDDLSHWGIVDNAEKDKFLEAYHRVWHRYEWESSKQTIWAILGAIAIAAIAALAITFLALQDTSVIPLEIQVTAGIAIGALGVAGGIVWGIDRGFRADRWWRKWILAAREAIDEIRIEAMQERQRAQAVQQQQASQLQQEHQQPVVQALDADGGANVNQNPVSIC